MPQLCLSKEYIIGITEFLVVFLCMVFCSCFADVSYLSCAF
jgi:hypothetical protein